MPSAGFQPQQADSPDGQSAIRCAACRSAVHSAGQQAVSFLLLDHLTIPLLGCDAHLEQFASLCGVTTDDTAELLEHHPAGGIRCPGCRHAPYTAPHPMIPIHDGALVAMACPDHLAAVVQRFQTGLHTRQQLTASLETPTSSSR